MWDDVQANATAPFVFEGKDDYAAFIALAGNAGLHVVARLGPYVCGERTNGGVPLWMRSEAACFRCSDPGWESHMATALTAMFRHVEPLLASSGGPIIALQVENECVAGQRLGRVPLAHYHSHRASEPQVLWP